jgi:hypothetical protein
MSWLAAEATKRNSLNPKTRVSSIQKRFQIRVVWVIVIQKLEKASDFSRDFSRLDTKELGLVERLKALAEEVGEKVADTMLEVNQLPVDTQPETACTVQPI